MKLNIYPQAGPHQEAYIVGDRAALESLWKTIAKALGEGKESSSMEATPSDGECYPVLVICCEDDGWWSDLTLPYASKVFGDGRSPFFLLTRERYRELMNP